jgi:hypothetical protein
MGRDRRKAMHINLTGSQIDDYELVKEHTGITNDNDLMRYLLRQKAHEIREWQYKTPPEGIRIPDEVRDLAQ